MVKVTKKATILGQDPDVLVALWGNVLSWFFATFLPSKISWLLPVCPEQDTSEGQHSPGSKELRNTRCISIGRPGGLEQLQSINLKDGIVTVGYNVKYFCPPPFTPVINKASDIPASCVILENQFFSINYADVTIRWGLYESAKKFVGWPIVPGFDVAGTIEAIGESSGSNDKERFEVGDRVFGCTLFGAYSNRILVPKVQLRKIPDHMSTAQAASLPAVSLTALYALQLAGAFPNEYKFNNKAVLIHSAAGGVGSMLIQMSKILGLGPIVGVVGSSKKVAAAKELGCDHVIDKSTQSLWATADEMVPEGFATIFDANGVSTLQDSYDSLAPTGRLVVFGFHSNLPMGQAALSPVEWIKMGFKMSRMPKFDAMDMTVSNKSVLAFNLSFFAQEVEIVSGLLDQIVMWLEEEKIKCPTVVEMDFESVAKAHQHLQSGQSIGKVVVRTAAT
jgi:NADPH:quinone reductase-like Zn-dependent oxidoreductase